MWSLRQDFDKQPTRVAASSEAANREFGGREEAARARLERATGETADLIGAQAKVFADRLNVEQTKMMEALDIYGQSIQSRLNLASVGLAREFRDSGEQLTKRVEAAGETAIATIGRQGDAVASAIGQSVENFERRLFDRSRTILTELSSVGDTVMESIAAKTEAAAARFSQTVEHISERAAAAYEWQAEQGDIRQRDLMGAVERGAQMLDERASVAMDRLERRLLEVASTLERMTDGALLRLENRIEERLESLTTRLVAVDKELDQQWASRRDGLTVELVAAAGEARSAAKAAADEVGRMAEDVAVSARRAFAESVGSSLEQMTNASEAAAQKFNVVAEQAIQTLSESELAIKARLDAFQTTVAAHAGAAEKLAAKQTNALSATLGDIQSLLTDRGGALVEAISASTKGLDEIFTANLNETETRLGNWREAWNEAFTTHVSLLDERALGGGVALRNLAEDHRSILAECLAGHHRSVAEGLASALSAMHEQLSMREHEAAESLARVAQSITGGLVNELERLADSLSSRGAYLRNQIIARQGELIEAIESGVARTETGLNVGLNAAAQRIDALAAEIRTGLAEQEQSIAATIAQATEHHRQAMSEGAAIAVEALDSNRRKVDAVIAEAVGSATAALDAGVAGSLRLLEARIGETAEALRAAQNSAASSAEDLLSEARRLVETGAREAEKTIDFGRERLVAALSEAAQASADDLSKHVVDRQRALEDNAIRAVERVEASRAALVGVVGEAADHFTQDLAARAAELQLAMARGTEKLRSEFAEPLAATLARIETEGAEIAGATRVLAETLVSSSTAHREQLHQTFAREADALSATVSANAESFQRDFQAALTSADNVFLSRGLDLAHSLAERVGEFRSLLEGEGLPLLKALDARSQNLSQQIEAVSQRALGDFERKATALIGLLTRRGDDLLSAMTAAASESARKVAQHASEVDAGANKADSALREIERKLGAMLALLDRRSAELPATDGKATHSDDTLSTSA